MSGTATGMEAFLFFGVCLVLGLITRYFFARVRMPFSAILLLWGLIIGFMEARNVGWTELSAGIQAWQSLDPMLLLLIFLPIIGFSSGFSFNPHIVRKNIGQVMVLAWPGVVVVTLLISLAAKYLLPYAWSWPQCLLFGAMFAATDPVACVALLKEVGASSRLSSIIEGESLFNDGSAFVMFLIFKGMAEGQTQTAAATVVTFCKLALGSTALGVAFGLVSSLWLGASADITTESMITLTTAYFAYYVSDHLLHISGLLAVCTLGAVMALIAKSRISPGAQHGVELIWGALEWVANCVLFVYMGVIIALDIMAGEQQVAGGHGEEAGAGTGVSAIQGRDWALVLLMFVILQVTRGIMLLLFWPALRRLGYGLTWQQLVVIMWAGLRGIVGTAMALTIAMDDNIPDTSFKSLCVFHMGMQAVLTILVNGSTTRALLRALGQLRTPPEKAAMVQALVEGIEGSAERYQQSLPRDDVLGEPDWEAVQRLTGLQTSALLRNLMDMGKSGGEEQQGGMKAGASIVLGAKAGGQQGRALLRGMARVSADVAARFACEDDAVAYQETLADLRCRFLHAAKAVYFSAFAKHYLLPSELDELQEATEEAIDGCQGPLDDWALVSRAAQVPGWVRLLLRAQSLPLVGPLVMRLFLSVVKSSVRVAATFVYAHRSAEATLRQYISTEQQGEQQQQQHHHQQRQGSSASRVAAARQVYAESAVQVAQALALVAQLDSLYPGTSRALKTQLVAQAILRRKGQLAEQMSDAGVLEAREAIELGRLLEGRQAHLARHPPRPEVADSLSLLRCHHLLQGLQPGQVEELARGAEVMVVPAGTVALRAGTSSGCVWLAVRGTLELRVPLVTAELEGEEVQGSSSTSGRRRKLLLHISRRVTASRQSLLGAGRVSSGGLSGGGTAPRELPSISATSAGVLEALTGEPAAVSYVAATITEMVALPAAAFMSLVQQRPDLQQRAWQAAAGVVLAAAALPELSHLSSAAFGGLLRSGAVQRLPAEGVLRLHEGGRAALLVSGAITEQHLQGSRKRQSVRGPALVLGQQPSAHVCLSPVVLLELPPQALDRATHAAAARLSLDLDLLAGGKAEQQQQQHQHQQQHQQQQHQPALGRVSASVALGGPAQLVVQEGEAEAAGGPFGLPDAGAPCGPPKVDSYLRMIMLAAPSRANSVSVGDDGGGAGGQGQGSPWAGGSVLQVDGAAVQEQQQQQDGQT